MRTNSDITIYNKFVDPATHSEAWIHNQVEDVIWEDTKAANVIASGLLEADRYTVYIPMARGENYHTPIAWQAMIDKGTSWTLQLGDVIVRGLVDDDISDTFTISDLKKKYDDVAVIRSVDRMAQGSLVLRHWQIGAN